MYKILIFLLISFSSVYAVDYTLNPDYDCVKNDFDATCTCQLGSFTSNTYHYGTSYHFAGIGVNYEIGRECSVSPVNITQIYDDGTGYRDGYYSYSSVLKECKNGSVISADGTTCECPSDMTKVVNDGVASCVCPSGTELVIAKKCPCDDGDTCEYPPQCMEPCPDGTQRNEGGSCCPIGKISYCDSQVSDYVCICPLDQAEINGTCTICDGSYPTYDYTDCSNCPPYYETRDGQCTDVPCSTGISDKDGLPYLFYYPISDTSDWIVVGADEYCFTAGDNSNTGTDSTDTTDTTDNNTTDSNTGDTTDNNTTDTTTDNNTTDGTNTGDTTDGTTSGTTDTFDDEGIINQLRENKTVEESIKTSVDGVKTSVDNVKNTLDQTNNKLDSIKGAVDETNNKLDSIKNLLDSNVTFSFDNLTTQMNDAFNNVNESLETVKNSFEQTKAVLEGDKTFMFPTGSFNGFHFEVWGKNIDVDPCPMLTDLRPFMTMITQFMFVLWSVFIMLWGFKR